MCDDRQFHVICSLDLSCTWCHTGAYFHFAWDLWIFTDVMCSTIDDFMSRVLLTCHTFDAILGHIFHFRWDLWFFTDVAYSMINDLMSPNLRPIMHSMPYWGILPFRMRFIDIGGVARLSLFARHTSERWSICYLYDDSSVEALGSCLVKPALLDT